MLNFRAPNPLDWAEQVAGIVEEALRTSQRERQPQFLRRQAMIALGLLAVVGA